MEEVKEEKKLIKTDYIIQPNAVTHAKYDYTAIQKNIMYQIIGQIQEKMTRQNLQKNLFGSIYVNVPIAEIAGNKNYKKVYDSSVELMDKKFNFNWKKLDGKEGKTTVALVSEVTHEKNSKYLQVCIPDKMIPVLLYIGDGFTKYQKTIAITLKGVHAKRLYEICHRWKDLGGYKCSLDEFREMMCLEDKYTKLSMLKSRVLDAAQKELKESADIYFEYKLEKNNSRDFNQITFKIIEQIKEKEKDTKYNDRMLFITNMLDISFPMIKSSKAIDLTQIITETEHFENIYIRFSSLRKELREGTKTKKDIKNLIPYILKNDFKIEC
jgi:plasmid replication initiation protein